MYLPNRVRFNRNQARTTMAMASIDAAGMNHTLFAPSALYDSEKFRTGRPFVYQSVNPTITCHVPSVAMIGEIRPYVTRRPFRSPTPAPAPIVRRNADETGMLCESWTAKMESIET